MIILRNKTFSESEGGNGLLGAGVVSGITRGTAYVGSKVQAKAAKEAGEKAIRMKKMAKNLEKKGGDPKKIAGILKGHRKVTKEATKLIKDAKFNKKFGKAALLAAPALIVAGDAKESLKKMKGKK